MSLNNTVSAERLHIGFFGNRNAGKSSLVNAVTAQQLSVVSDVAGTTTDPVKKAMELLPLGPVVIIDTAGFDDVGLLGELRVSKTREILRHTDIAVLVVDAQKGIDQYDRELISLFNERNTPYIVAYNKCELIENTNPANSNEIYVSAKQGININGLKEILCAIGKKENIPRAIVSDLLNKGETAVLVIPIDEAAPKGRLILPQQQTMRDLLDANLSFSVCQVTELADTLNNLSVKPRLVITDSQAFGKVSKIVPDDISLTSFSILFARYKGDLKQLVSGAAALKNLKKGDKVLISEGCTHHRQCNDIGSVKMPNWIKEYTNADIEFCFTSGGEFPEDLSGYALIVHCGGCMLNEKEMSYRLNKASESGIPIVNYGVAIAMMHGILERSLEPFPEILELIK